MTDPTRTTKTLIGCYKMALSEIPHDLRSDTPVLLKVGDRVIQTTRMQLERLLTNAIARDEGDE